MNKIKKANVVCNSRIEYLTALEKAQKEFNYTYSVEWTILQEKELLMYGFPMYLMIDEDGIDWCIDFVCDICSCELECKNTKKISYSYYMTNGRKDKLERLINEL